MRLPLTPFARSYHQFDRCHRGSASRIAQTAVDDALRRHRHAADRAPDSIATEYVVFVVHGNRGKRLAFDWWGERYVLVDELTEGFARIGVHPAHFVHVFGEKARFCDVEFFHYTGDGLG